MLGISHPIFFWATTKAKEETVSFTARFVQVSGARGAAAFVPRGVLSMGKEKNPVLLMEEIMHQYGEYPI